MLKWLFAGLVLIHGLIHLMGFAKAFDYADLSQLTVPISRPMGLAWLAAAGLFLAAMGALFVWPRGWWLIGAVAIVVSQGVISASWTDAKFGTLANGVALAGVVFGFAHFGPRSFRAEFDQIVDASLLRSSPQPALTEADIAPLPPAVRRYIRHSGAVGQPRVQNVHATFRGRIRSGPGSPWMSFTGEQYNFFDPPARLFVMDASKYGIPVDVFHRFIGPSATMRVKAASIVPMVDASGPEMTRGETVTLFNDMCVLAPGALSNPAIRWREIDGRRVAATFTNEGFTIEALLTFNEEDELIDFVSEDRSASSPDGKSFTPMRWSTPLSGYRSFGGHIVSAYGAGRWHPPGADPYDYIELSRSDIRYNVTRPVR